MSSSKLERTFISSSLTLTLSLAGISGEEQSVVGLQAVKGRARCGPLKKDIQYFPGTLLLIAFYETLWAKQRYAF